MRRRPMDRIEYGQFQASARGYGNCAWCRHFHPLQDQAGKGECRAQPPTCDERGKARWPAVLGVAEWCSMFTPRPPSDWERKIRQGGNANAC